MLLGGRRAKAKEGKAEREADALRVVTKAQGKTTLFSPDFLGLLDFTSATFVRAATKVGRAMLGPWRFSGLPLLFSVTKFCFFGRPYGLQGWFACYFSASTSRTSDAGIREDYFRRSTPQ